MQLIVSKNKILYLLIVSVIFLTACMDTVHTPLSPAEDILKVHFIDVGQADCILIQERKHAMLIDAGNNVDGDLVVNYIRKQGIQKLDAVVGTHPHADHIGGLDVVINHFDVQNVWLPKVSHNSQTFIDVLKAIKDKDLKINSPTPGESIRLGDAQAIILAPSSETYEEYNNYSIVLKLQYHNTSFLFTGDAESISGEEMLSNPFSLKADVLKIAHHGSHSSTTSAFLEAVGPQYAIIQCGQENSYGHPHRETIEKLNAKSIIVYRTDQNGTIVATSNGKTIEFNMEKQSYQNSYHNSTNDKDKIYIDQNGNGLIKGNINTKREKIYHMPNGAYYQQVKPEFLFKTEKEAQLAGFRKSQK